MTILEYFFKAFDCCRKIRALSQKQVAEFTGINENDMSRYRNGKRGMDDDLKAKVADFFGYDLLDFLNLGRSAAKDGMEKATESGQDEGWKDKYLAALEENQALLKEIKSLSTTKINAFEEEWEKYKTIIKQAYTIQDYAEKNNALKEDLEHYKNGTRSQEQSLQNELRQANRMIEEQQKEIEWLRTDARSTQPQFLVKENEALKVTVDKLELEIKLKNQNLLIYEQWQKQVNEQHSGPCPDAASQQIDASGAEDRS